MGAQSVGVKGTAQTSSFSGSASRQERRLRNETSACLERDHPTGHQVFRRTFRKNRCSGKRTHLVQNTPLPRKSRTTHLGPFGELIRATGPMAKLNPFTFQTEYWDQETDKYYWKHRYYDPSTGRWLSRDPINESGFKVVTDIWKPLDRNQAKNLYTFVFNNAITLVDLLGLSEQPLVPPRKRAPEGCDIACCTADKTNGGKDELIARFNDAKALMDGFGIKRDPNSENGSSCYESNQAILQYMTPTPPCWTCAMERRRGPYSKPGVGTGPSVSWDENFIVCVSHPKTGKGETIIFDWFEGRPAGESYSSFASDHPYFEERGGWYSYNDCSQTIKRQPRNIGYLEALKK